MPFDNQYQNLPCWKRLHLPLLQLVKIASSVNSSQHSGSGSICLDCVALADSRGTGETKYTITGGNIAVVALGSTGCSIVCSSSPSAETLEFDLRRLLVVFCVSALCNGFANRLEILPRCRTEDCSTVVSPYPLIWQMQTYRFRPVQHAHAEIP